MTPQEIRDLGFTQHEDDICDIRGKYWTFENDNFRIKVDAWYDVTLTRKFPDGDESDGLYLETIDCASELQELKDWIA
jgi:hypothetical protein